MFKLSGSNHPNLLHVYQKAKKVYDEGLIFRKRKRRQRIFRVLRRVSIGIIAISCIFAFYSLVHFMNFRTIHAEAIKGTHNIEKAIALAESRDNKSAIYYAKLAQDNFDTSLMYINEYEDNFLVRSMDMFDRQYSDIVYLLSTAKTVSRGVEEASLFGLNLDLALLSKKDSNNLEKEDKTRILKFIYESAPELYGIKANMDLASASFNNIKYTGILYPFRYEIKEIGNRIKATSALLDQQIPMSQILPSFFGYPEKSKYLFVFQDTDKTMPSGGVIKAYGIMENSMGEIVKFDTFDSQKLDEKSKDLLTVDLPLPLRKYTEKEEWLMSDSNWSPDWPYSAEKIMWFYKKETGDDSFLNGVVAVNPEFIKDLLDVSGPIIIDNISYNSNNFSKLYQEETDKNIFGKLLTEINLKLFNDNFYDIANLLVSNFNRKNILLYFNDISFQQIAEEKGWSNKIYNSPSDYLMVVDSNVGDKGGDKNIGKNIEYLIDQDVNGVFADLHVNYINSNSFLNSDSVYENYVRIYVPQGSELILVEGFDDGSLEVLEDTKNGKAIFAGLLTVKPGEIASLRAYYKLPESVNSLAKLGEYRLFAQKQPGNNIDLFTVDLKVESGIRLYNPTGFDVDLKSDKQIQWKTNLLSDRAFNINF